MTEEQKQFKMYLKEAYRYNRWRRRAERRILSDIAPRVAQKGFSYDIKRQVGKLIVAVNLPWEPQIYYLDKCKDDMISHSMTKLLVEMLIQDIFEIEKRLT